jgi:hypothetical protein
MHQRLAGTWHNQHGSKLVLEVGAGGRISGKMRSGTGLAKGGEDCEVTGFVAGDLVVFCANFGEFDSLTAWTGHLVEEDGEAQLVTQWQMAVTLPARGSAELWKGTWTGSDLFRRELSVDARPPLRMPSHPLRDWP